MSPSVWFRGVSLCALVIVVAVAASLFADEAKGKKYALLVGVKEYKRQTFPDLKYTENDVEKLATSLKKAGYVVRVLTNTRGKDNKADAPTAENVRKALADLIEDKGRADTVLVALSGHGAALEVPDPDDKGKPKTYPFFCPYDADVTNVSYSTGRSKFLLNVNDLFASLGKCGAGVKLVLMDACRNEMKAEGSTRGFDEAKVDVPRGIGALFSCSTDERAWESEKLKHGVFFHFVLEALTTGKASNNKTVTFDQLVSYVVDKVSDETPKIIGGNAKQTPDRIITYKGKSPVLAVVDEAAKEEVVKAADTFENSIKMKLVRVKAGEFQMGSPKGETGRGTDEDQHKVKITKDFYVGVTEVTQGQYRAIMGYNPSYFSTDGTKSAKGEYKFGEPAGGEDKVAKLSKEERDNLPVENVSWEDAKAFLNALNVRALEQKYKVTYRLPTEAEWEYACRGGHLISEKRLKADLPFHFKTATDSLSSDQANFDARDPYGDGKKANSYLQRTNMVSENGAANPLGIYDMHGNVWEWCQDWYGADYYGKSPAENPEGPDKDGVFRVDRGGSWGSNGRDCRAAKRDSGAPVNRYVYLGFRVAAVPHK